MTCRPVHRAAWLITRLGPIAALYPAARWWFMRWGADVPEIEGELPGDSLIDQPSVTTTRAITIDAPPEAIWPWLVQMGQNRAGLYSYDWLESLVGLHFHNADRIVPEWQRLEVGDQIRAAPPTAGPDAGFTVVAIAPLQSIVTVVGDPARVLPAAQSGSLGEGATWVFVLRQVDEHRTRLIVRFRARFGLPPAGEWIATRVLEPIHFIMERKQLLGIAKRARATELRVRIATEADEAGVVACVTAAYQEYVPLLGKKPAPMLADYPRLIRDGYVHLAVAAGSIVGLIVMWPEDDHWYIDNIAVLPEAQGRGVGKLLLDRAEAAARSNGCDELRLYTNEVMKDNLGYYPRRGFVETHRSAESGYRRVYYSKVLA